MAEKQKSCERKMSIDDERSQEVDFSCFVHIVGEIGFRLFHGASKMISFEVLLGKCVILEN